jgi:hypothetical protein
MGSGIVCGRSVLPVSLRVSPKAPAGLSPLITQLRDSHDASGPRKKLM